MSLIHQPWLLVDAGGIYDDDISQPGMGFCGKLDQALDIGI